MAKNIIGPTIPPGLRLENNSSSDSDDAIGPSLPPGLSQATTRSSSDKNSRSSVIGPSMPPGFAVTNEGSSSDDDAIGPSLPPGLKVANQDSSGEEENMIGPVIPGTHGNKRHHEPMSLGPKLCGSVKRADSDKESGDNEHDEDFMGPALPPGFKINQGSVIKGPSLPAAGYAALSKGPNSDSEEEDFNVVGPLPSEMARGSQQSSVAEEFEKRASTMKDKLTKKEEDVPLERESWMLELPPEMGTNFGLSARKFRSKPSTKGEDRSSWTDTPADRARKEQEAKSGRSRSGRSDKTRILSARDKMLAEKVEEYNKNKRKDTLLDMHQSELKRKKKEEKKEESTVRRPFDRDQDLQVNRFDDAQRKSVIKKSQQLNTRFSHGGSQFL